MGWKAGGIVRKKLTGEMERFSLLSGKYKQMESYGLKEEAYSTI